MANNQTAIDDWLHWADGERRKHRVMTVGEYIAWARGGDAISSNAEANPFPGGLTILFNTPPIIGKTMVKDVIHD